MAMKLLHQDTGKIISQKDYLNMVNEEEKEKYFPIKIKKQLRKPLFSGLFKKKRRR